ncbi:hypothetical protein RAS1_09270 [Phycisphaerae bacterium RAS1]|nr:hypothetical protein RAS1_09270 [Phycisphaerae bacterium RAS1]
MWNPETLSRFVANQRSVLDSIRWMERADDVPLQPASAGQAAALQLYVAVIGNVAGNEGSQVTACGFVYDVWRVGSTINGDVSGRILAGATPARARTAVGRYVAAPLGSLALVYQPPATQSIPDPVAVLLQAYGEIEAVTPCTQGAGA